MCIRDSASNNDILNRQELRAETGAAHCAPPFRRCHLGAIVWALTAWGQDIWALVTIRCRRLGANP